MPDVEVIYPKSRASAQIPREEFYIGISPGLNGEYLTDEEFRMNLSDMLRIPKQRLAFIVMAMSSRINPQTGQVPEEDVRLNKFVRSLLVAEGLSPYDCLERQEYGRLRVTSEQATLADGLAIERSAVFVALPTVFQSENAMREIRYRLSLGKSVISLFREDATQDYYNWLTSLIKLQPTRYPSSALVHYRDLNDLVIGFKGALGKVHPRLIAQ